VPRGLHLDPRVALSVARGASALIWSDDAMFTAFRVKIAELAVNNHLPTICGLREVVKAGPLMAYGTRTGELYRRAGAFVAKILNGAKPADLPVEQPTKFELVINLKTAKALNLTIPQTLLLRADQLIE
jgi:putative ABC transport system substrate-binding protein